MSTLQIENTKNCIFEHSLSKPKQQSEQDKFYKILVFISGKMDQGYSEEIINEFFDNAFLDKKFLKYVKKQIAKEHEFDERLLDEDTNFNYIFEKYLEFKGGKNGL